MKVNVRFATDADGSRIGELAAACGYAGVGIDWSHVEPYWIVAEIDDAIAAAIQVLVGRPFARMDYLFVDPCLSKLRRGAATKRITDFGLAIAHRFGSTFVSSSIDTSLESYRKVAERREWSVVGTAWSVVRRVTSWAA